MSAVKYAAIGTELWIGDGASPETFFKYASIGDIMGPKMKADTIDVTTHDSTGGYKEYIPSLKDAQEITFPIKLDPNLSDHNETATVAGVNAGGLKYLFEARVRRNMSLVYPTSPTARFDLSGQVIGYEPDAKVTGDLAGNIVVKVSGKPTLRSGLATGNRNSIP